MQNFYFLSLTLVILTANLSNADAQIGKFVFQEKQNWSRGNLLDSGIAALPKIKEVSKFDKHPSLKLKWAIVSGDLGRAKDQVRARIHFNNEVWVDLFAKKISPGVFQRNVVSLQEKSSNNQGKNENESLVLKDADNLPDLRIVDWNHDILLVKLTLLNDSSDIDENDKIFQFDLSGAASN